MQILVLQDLAELLGAPLGQQELQTGLGALLAVAVVTEDSADTGPHLDGVLGQDEDAETLGDIVAGLQPPDKLGQVTRSLATAAHDMRATFEAKIPGGRAKPDVWANWPDYSKRMDDFELKAAEMAKLGEAGNLPAVTAMLGAALPCKECHDVYRLPKK